jgi:preprotein translocase subunit SecA
VARRAAPAEALLSAEGAGDLALVVEAVRRATGLSLRDNQVLCALTLLAGDCAELRTGEGKTLAAATAALAAARCGSFVHVVTVNDYLAARDRDLATAVAARLGLSVGAVLGDMSDDDKRAAYGAEIVYGTNKTFVFDALRDMREVDQGRDPARARQAGQAFAIVDEADSVLIDDATVPMILSEPTKDPPEADIALFRDLLAFAGGTRPDIERARDAQGSWRLTARGVDLLAEAAGPWSHPAARDDGLIQLAEMAMTALHAFRPGEAYVVRDGEVAMIDQGTGRIMGDRKWAYGMQQMVELKEGVTPSPEARIVAQVTQQTYFRHYRRLSGLTGTARECRGELWAIYQLPVRAIAPHAPPRLTDLGLRLHRRAAAKWKAVVEVALGAAAGRAVLIGVNDVAEAQALEAAFAARGHEVAVLDALSEAQEAELVGQAGQRGRITVATHLAGRGTDIALDSEVRAAGGLHVIVASAMASARLERQLHGRAGRQGDPGSFERHFSLEDRGLVDGAAGPVRWLARVALRMRLWPSAALAAMQRARDAQARTSRRRTLLREQDLVRHLGYR